MSPSPLPHFDLGWKLSSFQKQTNIMVLLFSSKNVFKLKMGKNWCRILSRPNKDKKPNDKNQARTRSQIQIYNSLFIRAESRIGISLLSRKKEVVEECLKSFENEFLKNWVASLCQKMKIKSNRMGENITLHLPVIKMSIPVWEDFNPKFLRQKELPFIECGVNIQWPGLLWLLDLFNKTLEGC